MGRASQNSERSQTHGDPKGSNDTRESRGAAGRVLRWLGWALAGTGLFALVLIGVGLVTIEILGRSLAAETRIEDPKGIESLETIPLGGVEQTIYLRGRDRTNPILLFLHGGPGAPETAAARDFGLRLEEHFVVVHWDQRGAGNSCSPDVPDESLNLGQYLSDTRELVNRLRERFRVQKIHVMGHSWGSVLGLLTVQRHPELFHSYVGIGQVVHMRRGEEISYRFVVDRARAEGNTRALEELATIAPPYANNRELFLQRGWLGHYHGDFHREGGMAATIRSIVLSPEYSLAKKLSFSGCLTNSIEQVWHELDSIDFLRDVPHLDVPAYFFVGRHDYNTPFELVEEYVEKLSAPHKEIVWFDESAHSPNVEEPDLFQEVVIEKLGSSGRARPESSAD